MSRSRSRTAPQTLPVPISTRWPPNIPGAGWWNEVWLSLLASPNRLWFAVAVAVAAGLVASAGYGFGYGSGRAKGAEKLDAYKVEVHERELKQERELSSANDRNRSLENDHAREVADLRTEYATHQADAKARDDQRIADLRSGNDRLRVQVTNCRTTQPDTAATASGGADGAGTAELAPEAAAALWAIASDGDRAIRKLTALQAWARSAVDLCGGGP